MEECSKSTNGIFVLNETCYAEVIFLLHQAKEQSDANKFVVGLKMASLLFATNNAHKYCFISAEFFKWWDCASEAEKKLFAEVCMTKKTKDGKTIFTDHFIE